MKQTLKYLFPLFLLLPAFAFGQVVKTGAVPYTKGTSPYTPNIASSSEIRIDTATSQLYWWSRDALTWRRFQPGIDVITGGVAPAYTPRDNQSLFAINDDDELYYYDGSTWNQVSGVGDDWGTEVVQRDSSLQGNGTVSSVLGIKGYGSASNNQVPSKTAGGITWITPLTAEVDGSITNEGSLSVGAGGSNSSTIVSNTSGSTAVTISGSTTALVTESGSTITVQADTSLIATVNDVNAARNRNDSTFVRINGSYDNKRVTSNVWRGGTTLLQGLGGATSDTSGLLILSAGASATKPGIWFDGNQQYIFEVEKDSRGDSLSDFTFVRGFFDNASTAGDNQVLRFGWNKGVGGGRKNTANAALGIEIEEKYNNAGWPVSGAFYELHIPDIQFENGGSTRPLTGYFGHTAAQGGYWGMNTDYVFFADYAGTQKGWISFKSNPANYTKGITLLDTATIYLGKPQVGVDLFRVRNAANSADIGVFRMDASNRLVINPNTNDIYTFAPNIIFNTLGAIFTNDANPVQIGTASKNSRLAVYAPGADVITMQQPGETTGWTFRVNATTFDFKNPSGAAPFEIHESAAASSIVVKSDSDVGFGTNNPTARGHFFTSSGATKALLRTENSTGSSTFYRSNASPEAAITGNPGDLAQTNVSSIGNLWVKKVGTGNTGWERAETAVAMVTKAVPTTASATREIGVITHQDGGGAALVEMDVVVAASGFAATKSYVIPLKFNSTGGNWQILLPYYSTGLDGANDFNVEIKTNTTGSPSSRIDTLRITRTTGSTVANAICTIRFLSAGTGTTFTETSATGTSTTTATFAFNALSQVANRSGVNQAAPTAALDVIGTGATSATDALRVANSGGTRQLTVRNDGRTGVGNVTAPANVLDVEGAAVVGATYSGSNTAPTNGLLVEGGVAIGNTSADAKLDVTGSGNTSGTNALLVENSDGTDIFIVRNDQNSSFGTTPQSTVRLTIRGSSADTTATGLDLQRSSGTPTLRVRNDGKVSLNNAFLHDALNVNGDTRTDGLVLTNQTASTSSGKLRYNNGGSNAGFLQLGDGDNATIIAPKTIQLQAIDYNVDWTTGRTKAFWTVPARYNGYKVSKCYLVVSTIGSGSNDVEIEKGGVALATQTISSSDHTVTLNNTLSTGDIFTFDVTSVGGTPSKGLFVELELATN